MGFALSGPLRNCPELAAKVPRTARTTTVYGKSFQRFVRDLRERPREDERIVGHSQGSVLRAIADHCAAVPNGRTLPAPCSIGSMNIHELLQTLTDKVGST